MFLNIAVCVSLKLNPSCSGQTDCSALRRLRHFPDVTSDI